jgi:signal transduction histidine kinase
MLTLSHIETGEIQLQPENVPLKELLTSAVDLQEIHRQKKSLKVIVQCPANLRLTTDSKILNEIISNLISNAYKYSLQGGGVQVVAKKIDKKIHIIITDTGLGIPEDEQSRLFTKFFRASNVIDKKEEGSGIGLYMVYSLVKILGGTISYDSEENKGTTFTLIFSSTAL